MTAQSAFITATFAEFYTRRVFFFCHLYKYACLPLTVPIPHLIRLSVGWQRELQQALVERGLSKTGKKTDLAQRLFAVLEEERFVLVTEQMEAVAELQRQYEEAAANSNFRQALESLCINLHSMPDLSVVPLKGHHHILYPNFLWSCYCIFL